MSDQCGANRELVPGNDLEKKLSRIGNGRTTFLKGFNFFLNSLVVVLMKPAGDEETAKGKALTLRGPEGEPLLVIFSSGGRAADMLERHDGYRAAVTIPAWQMISGLPPDRGIVVNPGWSVGFTVAPEQLIKLRKRFRLERK
jgi:hypothetical protein